MPPELVSSPFSTLEIRSESRRRWQSGEFVEEGVFSESIISDSPWIKYETYMRAQIISAERGELGRLLVDFPAHASEDNQLHVHPISDRLITVIQGEGTFIALRKKELIQILLVPGKRVWMPRGVLHTFLAGSRGLLVESLHNPWIPIEDPKCLVYPNKQILPSPNEQRNR